MRRLLLFVGGPAAFFVALYGVVAFLEHRREIRHAVRSLPVALEILQLANVDESDVVYDLECGDGTLSVIAAQQYRARVVCVENIPRRVDLIAGRIRVEALQARITVLHADWRTIDLSPASVVVLFSPMQWHRSLRGQLTRQLRPGARIVSSLRNLGAWGPNRIVQPTDPEDGRPVPLFLWVADGTFRPQSGAELPHASIPRR